MTSAMSKYCKKIGYSSRQLAKQAVKRINQYLKGGRPLKDVYFCTQCQEWHTTSMDKTHSRAITRKRKSK